VNISKLLASAAAAGALTIGIGTMTAATAGAQPPTTADRTRDFSAEKARCTAAIDIRLPELTKLTAALNAAKNVSDAHKSTQAASLSAASSGLTTLKSKIAGDSDAATLKADCESIFEGYRVFALRAPQTYLVIAGDGESSITARLNDITPKLSDAIAKAAAAGKNVDAAKAALTDLQARLADASTQSGGVADSVIGYVPADYNANHDLLSGARSQVKTAAADLKAARGDIKTITAALKA
jgi:hypothetical protein